VIEESDNIEDVRKAAELLVKLAESKPLAKVEELEEVNLNQIDNVLSNTVPKSEGSPASGAGTLGRAATHRGRGKKTQGKRGTPVTTGETCDEESYSSCKQCSPPKRNTATGAK